MPFKRQGADDYTGPSGKHFNSRQVRYYYANGGHFAQGGDVMIKGHKPRDAAYAQGGSVLGRTKSWVKEAGDVFTGTNDGHRAPEKPAYEDPMHYPKNTPQGKRPGPDNSKSSIRQHKPRGS